MAVPVELRTTTGNTSAAIYIKPEAVTCIAPAGLPGCSRVHHDGPIELVLGDPQDVFAALFERPQEAEG